jgi:hypothetical protein
MQIEREQVLKAESHQRTGDRKGYAKCDASGRG